MKSFWCLSTPMYLAHICEQLDTEIQDWFESNFSLRQWTYLGIDA